MNAPATGREAADAGRPDCLCCHSGQGMSHVTTRALLQLMLGDACSDHTDGEPFSVVVVPAAARASRSPSSEIGAGCESVVSRR
jgi:hypothetical protein